MGWGTSSLRGVQWDQAKPLQAPHPLPPMAMVSWPSVTVASGWRWWKGLSQTRQPVAMAEWSLVTTSCLGR